MYHVYFIFSYPLYQTYFQVELS